MWLYGLFLVCLVGLALWYGVYTYFHYEGPGLIRVERTVMSPERDGRIQQIYPAEGETVRRGDSLMLVQPGRPCEPVEGTLVAQERRESRQQAELLTQRIQALQQELDRKRQALGRLRERNALELGDTEPRRNEIEERIFQIQSDIERLRTQRRQARETADQLATVPRDPECSPFVVTAPHGGHVVRVHEREFSFVDSGTPVLSLTRPSPSVTILAYLERDLTGYVQRGDTVRVFLPSGATTSGVVRDTYSTAQDFAQVKYDVYRPYAPQLLAEIAPASRGAKERWQALDRTWVEVEGEIDR
jgi:multidrug resistance efflux pump